MKNLPPLIIVLASLAISLWFSTFMDPAIAALAFVGMLVLGLLIWSEVDWFPPPPGPYA